jgi:ABC-2 type transport system permease protein
MGRTRLLEERLKMLDHLRIVWAIAAKDVIDGLKSRTIWRYIIIVLLIMVGYRYLPEIGRAGEVEIVIYDKGSSRLVEALQNSSVHEIRAVSSMDEFEAFMDDGDEGELGLVIPAGYDHSLDSGEQVLIDGYLLWASRMNTGELIMEYEATMTELIDGPVRIAASGIIIPGPDSMGNMRMMALIPLLTVLIVGVMVVPSLMFEEKITQTLDTLLVSPATIGHIIMGKALAGGIYCLSTGAIVLAFNWVFVVNWGLAIAAVLATALLGIALGLLLGLYLNNQQQLSMWSIILFQPLLIPVVFFAIEPIFPMAVRKALPWFPNVALAKLFHYSQTSIGEWDLHLGHLIVLAVSIVLLYALVGWKLRTAER